MGSILAQVSSIVVHRGILLFDQGDFVLNKVNSQCVADIISYCQGTNRNLWATIYSGQRKLHVYEGSR